MDYAVARYKKGNQELIITQSDSDFIDSRSCDNLGVMFCFHNRYNLGDSKIETSDSFSGWAEIEKYLIKEKNAVLISPLYLYDHSGLRIKIGSFNGLLPQGHAEFDSGQIGFIYTTKERIKEWFDIKKVTKKALQKAENLLKSEVEIYDKELSGDVYDFRMIEHKHCEHCGVDREEQLDSCGGFYGTDFDKNGLFEYAGIKDISEWVEQ